MTQRRLPDLVGGGKTVPCLAAALMAGAGLVGGCALQPTYVQPAAPVAATFPAGDAYKPAASAKAPPALAAATAAKAADIGWRDVLTDRRLQRLVEIGLANNRDLRVAALNVAQVQAQYRIQRATLFPQIDAAAGLSNSRTPASVSSFKQAFVQRAYSVDLSASWEIDFFGRLRSMSEAALQQYFATAQARKATEILLVSQIAGSVPDAAQFRRTRGGDRTHARERAGLLQADAASISDRHGNRALTA